MDDFDPLEAETFDSPHDTFRRLRRECPVAHSSAWNGFWALTRHSDVASAARDSDTFITSVQNVVPKVATTGRRPPLHLDPPEHTPYRRAIAPLLADKSVAKFRPVIGDICHRLLDPMVEKGGGDICSEYSAPMPIHAFAHWMNLPRDQIDKLADAGRRFNIAVQSADEAETKSTSGVLYAMARQIIADRKTNPMDVATDAASALLAARDDDGNALPDELIVGTIRQVLVVGIIAPTVLFGSICVHLTRDMALQDKLRSNLSLVPSAINEFLRLYTPYRGFARTPVKDVCIHGREIKKGEAIALVYASANRDEEVFENPDDFILDRQNINSSLAFGRGPHRCPGEPLARIELECALEALLTRTAGFELAGEVVPTRMPEIGALSVPLKFR